MYFLIVFCSWPYKQLQSEPEANSLPLTKGVPYGNMPPQTNIVGARPLTKSASHGSMLPTINGTGYAQPPPQSAYPPNPNYPPAGYPVQSAGAYPPMQAVCGVHITSLNCAEHQYRVALLQLSLRICKA
jgi:hypothetical protein